MAEDKKDPPPETPHDNERPRERKHDDGRNESDDGDPWNDGDAPSMSDVFDWFEKRQGEPDTEGGTVEVDNALNVTGSINNTDGSTTIFGTDGRDSYFIVDLPAAPPPPPDPNDWV